jgi:sulfate adenylyltransferase (ADP) / ATP adenylyltransferase
LAKKPTGAIKDIKDAEYESKPKPDPFENPSADLLVAEVPKLDPSHILVLNKYPVIANHFILATKIWKPQTGLLEQDDLSVAYACLKAWKEDANTSHELFAFFNSGEHSGASQPHRHLQFLPVEDMTGAPDDGWRPLLERMTERVHVPIPVYRDPALPLAHFAMKLDPIITPDLLHLRYLSLLRLAVNSIQKSSENLFNDETTQIEHEGKAVISYNLAMTTEVMAICPRRSESASIPIDGSESSVAANGTILGGTLMVKDVKEWDSLRKNPSLLDDILLSIGYKGIENDNNLTETKL